MKSNLNKKNDSNIFKPNNKKLFQLKNDTPNSRNNN